MSGPKSYRIKPGETWSVIARKFGLSTAKLASVNRRSPQSKLKAGEIIKVPVSAQKALMFDTRGQLSKFKKLNKKLLSNRAFRGQFLKNPARVLEQMGIKIDPELLPKDYPVLRLMDDVTFKEIAKKGDREKTRLYLLKHYPELIPGEVMGATHWVETADAVVDIAVALPVVAVADPIV